MSKQARVRRIRRNGQLMRLKRPDSAKNAVPRKISIIGGGHGGLRSKALLRDPLDLRTNVGKTYHAHKHALRAHLGGDPTIPEEKLIDQAARLAVLADIAWGELMRQGALHKNGSLHPLFEAYLKATRDQRAVLLTLGLSRRAKNVPDLQTYLSQKAQEKYQEATDA